MVKGKCVKPMNLVILDIKVVLNTPLSSFFRSISEIQILSAPVIPALLGECVAHTGAINVSEEEAMSCSIR